MNTPVAATADLGLSPLSRTNVNPRSDRLFFTSFSLAFLLIALIGFARSYYLKTAFGTPPLSPLLHVHGALFTSWLVLLVAQTNLIATGNRKLHMRLGIAGAGVVVAMLVIGTMTAITAAKSPLPGPLGLPRQVFLTVPLFSILTFVVLFGFALRYRRESDIHKRLIMLGTIDILGAPIARIPGVMSLGPAGIVGAPIVLILIMAIYDYRSRGRVHPVTMYVGAFVAAFGAVRIPIGTTEAWLTVARWLTA